MRICTRSIKPSSPGDLPMRADVADRATVSPLAMGQVLLADWKASRAAKRLCPRFTLIANARSLATIEHV